MVLLVRCYYGPTGMQCGASMAQLGFVVIVAAHHDYGTMLVVGWQLGQGGQTKKQQSMRRQARFLENMGEAEKKTRAPTPASYKENEVQTEFAKALGREVILLDRGVVTSKGPFRHLLTEINIP